MKHQWSKVSAFLGPQTTRYLIIGVLAGFLVFAVEIAFALVLQAFFIAAGIAKASDLVLPAWVPVSNLPLVLTLVFTIGIGRALLIWAQIYLQGAVAENFKFLQRTRLLKWIFNAESLSTNDVTSLFNERTNLAGGALHSLQLILIRSVTSICLVFSLISIAPVTTILSGVAFLGLGLGMRRFDRQVQTSGKKLKYEWDNTNQRMILSIKNLLLVQIYGTQKLEEAQTQKSLFSYWQHVTGYHYLVGLIAALPQILGIALICIISLFMDPTQNDSGGILLAYLYLFLRLVQNLSEILKSSSTLSFYWPQLTNLVEWWTAQAPFLKQREDELEKGITSTPRTRPTSPLGWNLQRVGFCYPGAALPTLTDFSLRIAPGASVVLMGPSGSGKSTLLGLILGTLKPSQGMVSMDTREMGEKPLHLVRQEILPTLGYVGAESLLVEGTIYENLVYGLSTPPSDASVQEAISQAECQFVDGLPAKLQHRISEQGHGLSAGQKQRLSLARALLRKPLALILDEATANLDQDTELRLVQTLKKLKGTLTIIAATHRPAFAAIADQTIVLHENIHASPEPSR